MNLRNSGESNSYFTGRNKAEFKEEKKMKKILGAGIVFVLIFSVNLFAEEVADSEASKSDVKKVAEKVVTPVKKATEETGKVVKSGLKATETIVLDPAEALKARTNEFLPRDVELLSSESSSDEDNVGPRIKLSF